MWVGVNVQQIGGGRWWVFWAVVKVESFEHEYIGLADADVKSLVAAGSSKSGNFRGFCFIECVLE